MGRWQGRGCQEQAAGLLPPRGGGRRSGAEAGGLSLIDSPWDGCCFFLFFFCGGDTRLEGTPRGGERSGAVAGQPPSLALKQILNSTGSSSRGWENTCLALEEPRLQARAAITLPTCPQHGGDPDTPQPSPPGTPDVQHPPRQSCSARPGGPQGPAPPRPALHPPGPSLERGESCPSPARHVPTPLGKATTAVTHRRARPSRITASPARRGQHPARPSGGKVLPSWRA